MEAKENYQPAWETVEGHGKSRNHQPKCFKTEFNKKELLVPFNNNHILEINLKNKKISLNPMYYEI